MLYIVRHGQTAKNRSKLLQGRSNEPLNEEGKIQAALAGEKLRALGVRNAKVYSSPLIRAVETAEIIRKTIFSDAKNGASTAGFSGTADTLPDTVTVDERLIEMDYGPYEGMDLTNPAPEVIAFFKDFAGTPAPDGMEQLPHVVSRTGEFADTVLKEAAEGDVIISTHAIAMKGILEYLTPESHGSYWSKYIGNCEIYAAEAGPEGFGIPYSVNEEDFDTEALRGV